MLRKFRIKINNNEYLVEMEELTPSPANRQTAPVESMNPAPAMPAPPPVEQTPPTPPSSAKGESIKAPMPGNILDVRVKEGDQVVENQVLAILEAMKMENEIVAPQAGTITAVMTKKGTHIDVGQTIVVIG